MDEQLIRASVDILKHQGIEFEKGLEENEIKKVEETFELLFPPDLKLFLKTGLPISDGFPNWRKALNGDKEFVENRLRLPLEGILFDIKNSDFWVKKWGAKPKPLEEQYSIAEKNYAKYPKLIPIYSHRYIPSSPLESDNPVFSVHQTDIIYYGYDLLSYFENEFFIKFSKRHKPPLQPKIEFWDLVIENCGEPF